MSWCGALRGHIPCSGGTDGGGGARTTTTTTTTGGGGAGSAGGTDRMTGLEIIGGFSVGEVDDVGGL